MNLIANRYAQALFDATPADARDSVAEQLDAIAGVLEDPVARAAVIDPEIPSGVRQKACAKLSEGAHDLVRNLIGVLLDRHREALLLELNVAYRGLLMESRGEVEGVLETATSLDDATVERLRALASELTGKQVKLEVEVVPALVGGVRMRVGNTLFDSSVATAIEELERKLLAAPL
jgi:F-type H+-transporting ATPase subunit delta